MRFDPYRCVSVQVVAGFSKVVYAGAEVRITISTKHWQRVNQKGWQEEPLEEMSHVIYIYKRLPKGDRSQGFHMKIMIFLAFPEFASIFPLN